MARRCVNVASVALMARSAAKVDQVRAVAGNAERDVSLLSYRVHRPARRRAMLREVTS